MNRFPIKINKSEIQKTDIKIEFFSEIIENSLTSKCDNLFDDAHNFCTKDECIKCFEICDSIININPHYIRAYLKKIRCSNRKDKLQQLFECEDLIVKFPIFSTKIKLVKLKILREIGNRKEEITSLIEELSKLVDIEEEKDYDQILRARSYLKSGNNLYGSENYDDLPF